MICAIVPLAGVGGEPARGVTARAICDAKSVGTLACDVYVRALEDVLLWARRRPEADTSVLRAGLRKALRDILDLNPDGLSGQRWLELAFRSASENPARLAETGFWRQLPAPRRRVANHRESGGAS